MFQVAAIKEATVNFFSFLFKYRVTTILGVAFFSHIFLPRREHDITAVKKEIAQIESNIQKNDSTLLAQVALFSKNTGYANKLVSSYSSYTDTKKELTTKLDTKQEKFKKLNEHYKSRYLNYPSRRSLAWSLGLGVIIFTLSLRLMQKSHLSKDRFKRNADVAESFMGAIIGGYFFVWILDPVDRLDLPYQWYIALTIAGGAIVAIMAYFISKSRHKSKQDLKDKNQALEGLLKGFIDVNKERINKKPKDNEPV